MADQSLDHLQARLDALAVGDDSTDRRWAAYAAVLDHLAARRCDAEAGGWTSLALERDGQAECFRLFGIPPGGALRTEVPGAVARSTGETRE